MFERLEKPFLTVETGEAYQPIRLTYEIHDKTKLAEVLKQLNCLEKAEHANVWNWFWRAECDELNFQSLDSYQKNSAAPMRLGTVTLRQNHLYVNLPSFKRACLAVPFFHRVIATTIAHVHHADFINKVFGLDEQLPHGFSELFNEKELETIVKKRVADYEKVQTRCEHASTPEEAEKILTDYTHAEAQKPLPYAERYIFQHVESQDPDVVFLGFYIFIRGRELVAIRRWFGKTGYTLTDVVDETVEQVFGDMDIDIIE